MALELCTWFAIPVAARRAVPRIIDSLMGFVVSVRDGDIRP